MQQLLGGVISWVVATALMVGGLLLIRIGRETYRLHKLIRELKATPLAEAGQGTLLIQGAVTPDGELLRSPLFDQPCAAARYALEFRSRGTHGYQWNTGLQGAIGSWVRVTDETGVARVSLEGAELLFSQRQELEQERIDDVPQHARRALEQLHGLEPGTLFQGHPQATKTRLVEERLTAGVELRVIGRPQLEPSPRDAVGYRDLPTIPVFRKVGRAPLLLADLAPAALRQRFGGQGVLALVLGSVLVLSWVAATVGLAVQLFAG